ncbi:MAG TPA: serine/threonine-protein kinase [Chroococcidiopsis sp.]
MSDALPPIDFERPVGNRYRLISKLGAGGFGQTFLAEDTHLPGHPRCVVKLLKPQTSDPTAMQMARRCFDTEAQTLYRLGSHDQIPRLLAHFEDQDEFYLVQEFIAGASLSKELVRGKAWSQTQTITLLREILQILTFVHQQQVIHRDVKPSNMIRRESDGQIVLIDFGAVKQVSAATADPDSGMTNLTISIGTQGYMPNEQIAGKPRFSSDVYAVGVIGIQALTGTHPKYLDDDIRGEIEWHHLASHANRELLEVIDHMVRYDFRDRFVAAADALAALDSMPLSVFHSPMSPLHQSHQSEPNPTLAASDHTAGLSAASAHSQEYDEANETTEISNGQPFLSDPSEMTFREALPARRSSPFPVAQRPPAPLPTPPAPAAPPAPPAPKSADAPVPGKAMFVEATTPSQFLTTSPPSFADDTDEQTAFKPATGRQIAPAVPPTAPPAVPPTAPPAAPVIPPAPAVNSGAPPAPPPRVSTAPSAAAPTPAAPTPTAPTARTAPRPNLWAQRSIARPSWSLQRSHLAIALSTGIGGLFLVFALLIVSLGGERRRTAQQAIEDLPTLATAVVTRSLSTPSSTPTPQASELVKQAEQLRTTKRYADALRLYDQAIALQAGYPEAYWGKCDSLNGLSRPSEAIVACDSALAIRPQYAEAIYGKGVAYGQQNLWYEALELYERATRYRPDFAQAWIKQGVALQKLGRPADAIAAIDRGLSMQRNSAEAWATRAEALWALRRYPEARSSVDQALKIDATNPTALRLRQAAREKL